LAQLPFFPHSPLPLCFPRVRPWRHGVRPVAMTPTTKPQLIYTEPHDLHHLPADAMEESPPDHGGTVAAAYGVPAIQADNN
jgi:hypothetical protein